MIAPKNGLQQSAGVLSSPARKWLLPAFVFIALVGFIGFSFVASGNTPRAPDVSLNELSENSPNGDSTVYLGAGPGGTMVYVTRCSWRTVYTTGTAVPSSFELFHTVCQNADGSDNVANPNPPSCAPGWTSTQINWRPTSITQWGPEPFSQRGDAACQNLCTDEDWFEYPGGTGLGVQPVVLTITGIGERVCTQ